MTPKEFVQLSSDIRDDALFAVAGEVKDFEFDQAVVEVFPNMIERSVPDYWAMVDGIGRISAARISQGDVFYDLGCSLGAVAWSFFRYNQGQNNIVAVDWAPAMIERFAQNLGQVGPLISMDIRQEDVRTTSLSEAGAVSLHLTLQFLRPEDRQALLNRIHADLMPGGVLFLTEKVRFASHELDELVREMHHEFKHAQGYSWTEISQKAASIRHVMLVDTLESHRRRLSLAGFSRVTVWHRHFNFLSIMAEK